MRRAEGVNLCISLPFTYKISVFTAFFCFVVCKTNKNAYLRETISRKALNDSQIGATNKKTVRIKMSQSTITIEGEEVEILSAGARFAGYGHYKIWVELRCMGRTSEFSATTSNMPSYDAATDLEGAEKEVAFFQIIEHAISEELSEWMERCIDVR